MSDMDSSVEDIPLLAEGVPVVMPDLPPVLMVTSAQQYKAMGDATRDRILTIIKHQPMTAKQLADQLGIAPGTAGHHLQTLEAAGLAQVVARRMVHGIVAKYYARTARLFLFDHREEGKDLPAFPLDMMARMRDELIDVLAEGDDTAVLGDGFPHTRLTEARAKEFADRLLALISEFAQDAPAADGQVYAISGILFRAPRYLQVQSDSQNTQE